MSLSCTRVLEQERRHRHLHRNMVLANIRPTGQMVRIQMDRGSMGFIPGIVSLSTHSSFQFSHSLKEIRDYFLLL